jgi:hypothetical protein
MDITVMDVEEKVIIGTFLKSMLHNRTINKIS